MSHNFHVGQDVVALVDHNYFKKDEVLTVRGVHPSYCDCQRTLLDVGLDFKVYNFCPICVKRSIKMQTPLYFSELFAPLDSLTDISELTDLLDSPVAKIKYF